MEKLLAFVTCSCWIYDKVDSRERKVMPTKTLLDDGGKEMLLREGPECSNYGPERKVMPTKTLLDDGGKETLLREGTECSN
jgi:hypothetical protein